MAAEGRQWRCPGCGNVFSVPEGLHDPVLCRSCTVKAKGPPVPPVPPKPSPVPTHIPEPPVASLPNPSQPPAALSKQGETLVGCAILGVGAVLLFFVCGWFFGGSEDQPSQSYTEFEASRRRIEENVAKIKAEQELAQSSPIPSISTGDTITLNVGESGHALVADWDDHGDLVKFSIAGDEIGFLKMLRTGRAFVVTSGTQVKVIQTGIIAYEVRVLDGGNAGRSGWIEREFLKK